MSPTIKITYFPIKGKAEASRLALHVGGVEFQDERLKYDEFVAIKSTLPLGKQLPTLTVDGEVISQSGACLRYAGKLSGLYPTCLLEAARVDEVVGFEEDLSLKVSLSIHEKDEEKKAAMRKTLAEETLPTMFESLNTYLEKNGKNGFAANGKLSIADLVLYVRLSVLNSGILDGIPTTVFQAYPKVMELYNNVSGHPSVQSFNRKYNTPKIKLTYFNGKGRANVMRLALTYAGVDFEDDRLAKIEDRSTYPFGQLPVLTYDGKRYAQSHALDRFVAKITGLYPLDAELGVRVDQIMDAFEDVSQVFVPILYYGLSKEEQATKIKEVMPGRPTMLFQGLEKLVAQYGTDGYAVGSQTTIADIAIYSIISQSSGDEFLAFLEPIVKNHTLLNKIHDRVAADESIKAWVAAQAK